MEKIVVGRGIVGSLICNSLTKDHDVTLLEKGPEHTFRFPKIKLTNKKFAEVNTFLLLGLTDPLILINKEPLL